jgi:hypothetical protein
MTIERIDDRKRWDRFIDESPMSSLFHKWDFLKVTERHTGFSLLPYGIRRGNELVAVIPLFLKAMPGLRVVLSPPPMQAAMPYLGMVMSEVYTSAKQGKKESILSDVLGDLRGELDALRPNFIDIRFVPGFDDVRPFIWDGYEHGIRYTYTVDLTRPVDEIWGGLSRNLRAILRKYETNGYYLEKGSDISVFYQSVAERFSHSSMSIPMITKDYFETLFAAYPEHLGVYYLHDADGAIIGAVATHEYKHRFLYWVGNMKMNRSFGNEHLHWLLLKKAKEEGYTEFENVGANNANLNQFKTKFNPDLVIFMQVNRQDTLGRAAQWAYSSVINRRGVKGLVMRHIE